MAETFWKITAVAGIACLQMTFAWGRFNAWSTITGFILFALLLTIPWRQALPWPERLAYSSTLALTLVLATGRLFEDRLDLDLMSRPREIFLIWAVLAFIVLALKTLQTRRQVG